MALKTPPIKTLGVAGLVKIAIEIDKQGSTQEFEGVLKPEKDPKAQAQVQEPVIPEKSLTEIALLKVAAFLIKVSGVLLQYAKELEELRLEAYKSNSSSDTEEK